MQRVNETILKIEQSNKINKLVPSTHIYNMKPIGK